MPSVYHMVTHFLAAIAFYTCLPVPLSWSHDVRQVARYAPLVGMLIGSGLWIVDEGLMHLGMPVFTRSVVLVVSWIAVTGGLHLDGAMDTADGLAVADPQRRLKVMTDSVSGAFGVMVAIALLGLKVAALTDLSIMRGMVLWIAPIFGRWAQQVAIARYPYLKPTGKGSFHKEAIRSLWHTIPGLLLITGLAAIWMGLYPQHLIAIGGMTLIGGAIAISVGAWLNHKLGGHTGDTYGAVVEWTEALFLLNATLFIHL